MSNKWYIGQEIVCIKTHSQKKIKSGNIYKIIGLQKTKCDCNFTLINVGINSVFGIGYCDICSKDCTDRESVWWFNEVLFAPLEYNQDEINRVLEITIKEKL